MIEGMPEVDPEVAKKLPEYVDYALSVIEENPESLQKIVQSNGIKTGVPNYIAALVGNIEGIDPGSAIVVATTVLNAIDKMIMESGRPFPEEERVALISDTIQRVFEINKELGDSLNEQLDPLREGEQTEEPMIPEEEQGVF